MSTPNSYFVPGYGISRAVIQNEIRYHCGPDAIVRPYTFQVRNLRDGVSTATMKTNSLLGTRWLSHIDHWTAIDEGEEDIKIPISSY